MNMETFLLLGWGGGGGGGGGVLITVNISNTSCKSNVFTTVMFYSNDSAMNTGFSNENLNHSPLSNQLHA